VSQVRPLVPNFTIVALELTSTEIDKIWNFFGYKSAPKGPIP